MKLFYSKGACSFAVRIVINEIKLPCEYEAVDLKSKKTETGKDFLKINPKGTVPTLQIADDKVLTENAIIQQYLADTHSASDLLPSVSEFKRYRVLEWLNYVSTELHKGTSLLFNSRIPQDLKDTVFIPALQAKLSYLEGHFRDHTYLMGEHFTLPDAYLFVMLMWWKKFKFDYQNWPSVLAYFERLQERKAIIKSLTEEGIEL
jgi:glutathione S-transferase